MARVIDQQLDNITVASDGTRKSVNAGTGSTTYDLVLDACQMLNFNGANNAVDVEFTPSSSIKTIVATMLWDSGTAKGLGCNDGSNHRLYILRASGNFLQIGYGDGWLVTGYTLSDDVVYRIVGAYDGTDLNIYANGTFVAKVTRSFSGTSSTNFKLGEVNGGAWHDGFEGNVQLWDLGWGATDVQHDFDNPEWVYGSPGSVSISADGGSSLSVSNLKKWVPLTEATGNSTVKEMVGNTNLTMSNFPADPWTAAANQDKNGQQNVLMRNPSGVPAGLADANTLRFD
jgi:hypothetical protein